MSLLLAMLGCGPAPQADTGEAPAPVAATCDASGGRRHWVMTGLTFVRVQEDGSSDGFDLDGEATETGDDGVGCGIPDMVGLDGTEGVDNAFARLLPVLETTEFIGVEAIIDAAIQSGEVLLIPEIAGAESLVADDCVTVGLRRGAGDPMLDTNGELLASQTLDLDPAFADVEVGELPIVAGSVQARPFSLSLPVSILNADLSFDIAGGAIRYDLAADGTLSGVMAGGLSTAYLREVASTENVSAEVFELVDSVVDSVADLAPDDQGQCTQISITLGFSAVPVYVFEDAL
ncbi:hypothetical protein L6R53_12695 [Myxococcota bacterium]|nr:hypothetical protein [Myxococcota bacterium]